MSDALIVGGRRRPLRKRRSIAIQPTAPMIPRLMKIFCIALLVGTLFAAQRGFAGVESVATEPFDAPRFELAAESAYLFGFINSPHSYEIGAEFLTARIRWGVRQSDGWLRGYNQFYISAIAEPIFRGIENHYFGLNLGMRYNFVRPGSRFIPYFSGGLGLGWIGSHPEVPGGQGQDFTFNILSAAGISYLVDDHWKISVGA